ncbi:MAG: response regulator, partial [Oscillospiraceae bacterium]
LAAYGAVVTPAVDGQEAVDIFSQNPACSFDVILMDIQMPVLDGYGAAKAIRAMKHPDGATLPIFALTANAFKKEADQARESGMDDVVTKPLDVDVLLQKLSTLGAEQAGQEESV